MRFLRLFGLVALVGGGLLAVAAIVYAGYARTVLLPAGVAEGDPTPIVLMRYAWATALAGLALALAGTMILPRAQRA